MRVAFLGYPFFLSASSRFIHLFTEPNLAIAK